jgi:hypothetical protein
LHFGIFGEPLKQLQMKWILVLAMIANFQKANAQKLYVWCPNDEQIKARQGFLEKDSVNLIVFDGRVLNSKSKVECSSEDVVSSIALIIKKAYPSAIVNIVSDTGYYKDPAAGIITIKVGLSAYHAGFGSEITVGIGSIGGNFSYGAFPKGEWNGLTAYYVRLYDFRGGKEQKYTASISKLTSKPNMWGYKTAKNCLNETFMQANQDMLFFIDNSLMK